MGCRHGTISPRPRVQGHPYRGFLVGCRRTIHGFTPEQVWPIKFIVPPQFEQLEFMCGVVIIFKF